MKKNFIQAFALCMTVALPFLTSCSKEDDPAIDPVVPSEYLYVLNSGNMGSNDASLTLYDVKEGVATTDIFEAQNGRRLGDTGQDLVVYGSKMYIAVSGESTVEVTDLEAKVIRSIRTEGQPRYFAVDGGKVYVTYYNGYVARIDTVSLTVEAKVQVGRNPEQLTVANRKLYVANSGGLDLYTETGPDKTVSVIDIATFTETKKIEVVINPCYIAADNGGHVYVASAGNYGDIPNTLQKIDATTDAVSVMTDINGTSLAMLDNTLYTLFLQYDDAWQPFADFFSYDTANGRLLSDQFVGRTNIAKAFSISSDSAAGQVYIGASDYQTDGDVYIFDSSNNLVGTFETGLNPMKAVYVKR